MPIKNTFPDERRIREMARKMADGTPPHEIAKDLHMGRATMLKRIRDPNFMRIYDEEFDLKMRTLLGRTRHGVLEVSVPALIEIISDKSKSPAARVSAAKALFDIDQKYAELTALTSRLTVLEKAVQDMRKSHGEPVRFPKPA